MTYYLKKTLKKKSSEEATVVKENEQFKVRLIVESLNEYDSQYAGDVYVLIQVK